MYIKIFFLSSEEEKKIKQKYNTITSYSYVVEFLLMDGKRKEDKSKNNCLLLLFFQHSYLTYSWNERKKYQFYNG